MRLILFFLFSFIVFFGYGQDTTGFQPMAAKGYKFKRVRADSSMNIPSDTTNNKLGIARIDTTLYAGNGTKWTAVGSGSFTGVDSLVITTTGCVKSFSTWKQGTETVVGTVTQSNGVAPGTGIVTKTTGTTFTVSATTYTINCVTYQSRDTTITLTAAGNTGRIDVIKVNTSGVTTYGQGVEGEALPLPSLSVTEIALTYILVTDTGVFVSPPTDTALWVSVGSEIRNANRGRVRVNSDLQVGSYTPGAWDTVGIHTNDKMIAQDGFYMTNPSNSSLTKTGIGQGFGNAVNMWAGSNIVGVWRLIGNNTGNQFNILGGYNPASGGGEVATFSSTTTLSPTGANSINYTVFDAQPTYTQGIFGTGALRGFRYKPFLISLNTSRNIAFENYTGDIIHRNLAGSGTRMVVVNDTGLVSTQAIPGGGGGITRQELIDTANAIRSSLASFQAAMYDSLTAIRGAIPAAGVSQSALNDTAAAIRNYTTENIRYVAPDSGIVMTVVGDTAKFSVDTAYLKNVVHPYKSYVAKLSQSGTNPPVANIIYNDLGNITWSRLDVGSYLAELSGSFQPEKTFIINQVSYGVPLNGQLGLVYTTYLDADSIGVNSVDAFVSGDSPPSDDIIYNTYIEIRVYN